MRNRQNVLKVCGMLESPSLVFCGDYVAAEPVIICHIFLCPMQNLPLVCTWKLLQQTLIVHPIAMKFIYILSFHSPTPLLLYVLHGRL